MLDFRSLVKNGLLIQMFLHFEVVQWVEQLTQSIFGLFTACVRQRFNFFFLILKVKITKRFLCFEHQGLRKTKTRSLNVWI